MGAFYGRLVARRRRAGSRVLGPHRCPAMGSPVFHVKHSAACYARCIQGGINSLNACISRDFPAP
jgi:hypothetical protein